jgi:uncharacterized protein (DUF885 family)
MALSVVLVSLALAGTPAATKPAAPAKPAVAAAPAGSADLDARRKVLADLVKEQWEDNMQRHPIFASILGDKRWNDKVEDFTEAQFKADVEAARGFRARFAAIDTTGFPDQERLNQELMVYELDRQVEGARFNDWEMPVDQMSGIQIMVPQLPLMLTFQSTKDYEDYIARLEQVPRIFDQVTVAMRKGMVDGLVPPRLLLERAVAQTEALAATSAADSPLVTHPVRMFPKSFTPAETERLRNRMVAAVTDEVLPAYVKLAKFLREEYLPKGRTELGIWSLPDGAARYAFAVAETTTTTLTPEQIHELGLREVASIEAQMLAIAKQQGFKDLASFQTAVRANTKLKATSGQQLLDLYAKYIKDFEPALPKLFGRLPTRGVSVIAVEPFREKAAADAQYQQGMVDGSRPAYVQVNTYDATKRSLLEVEATAYHEGVPGHHLQIAIAQELPQLPPFRQNGHFGAYIEGWALYAERLGKELGYYQDPYSDYGRLQSEMLRAIRLVVDTGFHAKRWSRDQVVKFFRDHSTIDEISIQNETDRYVAWPAQALGYKVGQLAILEMRAKAEKALGSKFDTRRFHDEILGNGALPLDVLGRRIDAWIVSEQRPSAHTG